MKYFGKIFGICLFIALAYTLQNWHLNVYEALKYTNEQKSSDKIQN